MSNYTIVEFTQMTQTQKNAIRKHDLLNLLEFQTSQVPNIATETLKDIVTQCMVQVLEERLPTDLVHTIEEVKTLREELDAKTNEIKTLKKVIEEHQKFIENSNNEKKAKNVFITGVPIKYLDKTDSKNVIQSILSEVDPDISVDDYTIVKDFDCKPGNTRHSMLIKFNDIEKKKILLTKSKKLKDKGESLKYVYIKHDMSPLTKKENDRLYKVFKELKGAHPEPHDYVKLRSGKLYVNNELHDQYNLGNQLF